LNNILENYLWKRLNNVIVKGLTRSLKSEHEIEIYSYGHPKWKMYSLSDNRCNTGTHLSVLDSLLAGDIALTG